MGFLEVTVRWEETASSALNLACTAAVPMAHFTISSDLENATFVYWSRENGSTAVLKACNLETCQSQSLQRSSEYLVCVDLDGFVCWWFYWLAGFWIFATILYAFLATEVLTRRSFGINVWWDKHKAQEIQSTYQWTFAFAINMWELAIQLQPFKGWPWLQFFCTLSSLSEKRLAGHLNYLSDNSHIVRA